MSREAAERWVTISALIVGGVYAYRRLLEPAQAGSLKNIVGIGNPVPLGQFAVAWGFTYLVTAIMASASPGLGGGFAILIATGDLLTNTSNLVADVGKQETQKPQNVTAPATPVGHTNVPGGTAQAAAAAGEQAARG